MIDLTFPPQTAAEAPPWVNVDLDWIVQWAHFLSLDIEPTQPAVKIAVGVALVFLYQIALAASPLSQYTIIWFR